MGLWGKIKKGAKKVKKAAKKVAKAAETVVNAAEEVTSDVVETVGNGIEDGADAIGNAIENNVPGGKYIGGVFKWAGRVVSSALGVVGSVIKGVLGVVSAAVGGVIRIIGGIFSGDFRFILDGMLDIISGVFGAVLLIVGSAVEFVQTVLFLQAFERKLTEEELKFLSRVFQESVAFYNVRVVEGRAGIFSINDTPFTLGNTIYMKDRHEPEILVHECVHVWQYQNLGAWYSTDALAVQLFTEDAYEWEEEIREGKESWSDFNKEAQAEFIDNIYLDGELNGVHGNGVFYDADGKKHRGSFEANGVSYTDEANSAVAELRGAQTTRPSGIWS